MVFPTDTAYGLGVDATNSKAVMRLFKIKKRRPTKPVHIVVSGFAMAKRYAKFSPQAEKLFRKFLPGKLTLILPFKPPPSSLRARLRRTRSVPPQMGEGSSYRTLSAGTGTIGIRMPKDKIALGLVKKLGRPITATSANISSAPTAYSVSQIKWQYRNKKLKPDFYLDGGKLNKVRPSTMVRLTGSRIEILRRGPITKKQILKCIISVSPNISQSRRTAK